MALMGDTVKLRVEFRRWDGTPADPEGITLTIYSEHKNPIETIEITPLYSVDIGVYEYPYTIPTIKNDTVLYYRFEGILEGHPIATTNSIPIHFSR